jgi:hypothetical protein
VLTATGIGPLAAIRNCPQTASTILAGARFEDADFTNADLPVAYRIDMVPIDSEPTSLDLMRMDLESADFAGAELAGAKWPEGVRAKEGWRRDAVSGCLERTGTSAAAMN